MRRSIPDEWNGHLHTQYTLRAFQRNCHRTGSKEEATEYTLAFSLIKRYT